jgi:hypothetical protein
VDLFDGRFALHSGRDNQWHVLLGDVAHEWNVVGVA